MGTGYTRNDTANNIADGNVINAADFDGEYDAIEAAFNSSTGHTHDGTSAEGAPITVLGPSQEFVASSSEVKPSTNAGLDLGTSALKFKDLYLDGTAYIDGLGGNLLVDTTNALQFRDAQLAINSSADGQLDIAADTTAKITSPEVIVTDDFRLQSDAAILTFGADDDVSVTHVADTGLDAKAASGFVLKLQTGDTTVESGNTVGKISFNAPDEAGGTDAILVGAEIEAAAEATFSSTDNSTALVFKTNTSAAATERMRIKSDGDIVTQGANYTMTWDHSADTLRFADGAKANFGADDDLQIYHDGSNSIITDTGTGNLILKTDGNNIQFEDNSGNDIFKVTPTGTNIYHGTSGIRLQTTTEGIDVTGDISVGNLNVDTNTISSTDTNGDINLSPNGTGTVVINTDLDVDNININGNSIISTDTNGDINITPNGTGKVNIAGGFVPSEINLTSTDAGATAGPVFELHRNSASPADNDAIGAIDFAGQDDGGNKVIYASIDATIMDATDTTEDGRLDFITQVAGSNYSRMRFDPTETVFNEAGADINFRIEGDTEPNLFVVDASADAIGIGTDSPDNSLHIAYADSTAYSDATRDAGVQIENTDSTTNAFSQLHFRTGNSDSYIRNIREGDNLASLAFLTDDGGVTGDVGEAMRIDSSQRVLIGLTSDLTGTGHKLQLNSDMTIMTFDGTTTGANGVRYIKSRATSPGSNAIVADGDDVGFLDFRADDGTDYATRTAVISSAVDGTPGSNDMPGRLQFYTTADGASSVTERMRINRNGHVGIGGQTDPDELLHLRASTPVIRMQDTDLTNVYAQIVSADGNLRFDTDNLQNQADTHIAFKTDNSEAMRIDSSQRVLIGGQTSARSNFASTTSGGFKLGVEGTNADNTKIATVRNVNGVNGPYLVLGHTRASAVNGVTVLAQDDHMGTLSFQGADGTGLREGANIRAEVDGALSGGGAADMPGRLIFSTTPNGAASATERMRINARGDVYTAANSTLSANLMNMYGGTITIPGNTTRYVTFSGSQLSGGSGVAEVTIGFYGSAGTGTGGLKVIDAGHWGGTVYHQATEVYRFSGNLTVNAITETATGWKAEVVNGVAQAATGFYMIHANTGTQSQDMTDIVTVETS